MSRQVPMDQALTDEDRRYLRMLGAQGMALEARLDDSYPPDPEELNAFNTAERKAAAELNGVGLNAEDQTALMRENERLLAELEALKAAQGGTPQPYKPPTLKADLEAEIDRVNREDTDAGLVKGTVAEMTTALLTYFAE